MTRAPSQPPVAPPATKKSPVAMIGGAVALLACLAGGYWWTSRVPTTTGAPADPFAALDAEYRSRGEPLPPAACRRADEAPALNHAADEASLGRLQGPEAGYVLARIKHDKGTAPGPELQRAVACSGFAAALSLEGKARVREAEAAVKRGEAEAAAELYAKAARSFDAAIAAAPEFKNARFNRALVLLKQNKLDDGVKDLSQLVTADPSFKEAHFYLGVALEAQARGGDAELAKRAKEEFCTAYEQGVELAKSRCEAAP